MAQPADQSRFEDGDSNQLHSQSLVGDQEQPDELYNDDDGIAEDADMEGVPTFEDDFVQQFLHGRNALIAEEKQRRSGL